MGHVTDIRDMAQSGVWGGGRTITIDFGGHATAIKQENAV